MDPNFYLLPGTWPPLIPVLPYSAGLVVSSVPMHLHPSVITDQPDPNSILIHHFPTHLHLEQCHSRIGRYKSTVSNFKLGLLGFLGCLSSIPFEVFTNYDLFFRSPRKMTGRKICYSPSHGTYRIIFNPASIHHLSNSQGVRTSFWCSQTIHLGWWFRSPHLIFLRT